MNTSIVATMVGVALVAAATFSAAAQAPQPIQYVQLQRSTAQLVAQLDMAAAPTLEAADILFTSMTPRALCWHAV